MRLYKMSLRCVEMSLYLSDNLSFICLFSDTFRLRWSFFNIFFPVFASYAAFPLLRHDETSATSDNPSSVFRPGMGIRFFFRVTRGGCRASSA